MILKLTFREELLRRLHVLPAPLMDAFGSVLFGRALAVAARAGFFEALREKSLSSADIARKTGFHIDGTRLLAESFVEGGYLKCSKGMFRLSAEGRKWLLAGSTHSIVNLLLYFGTLHRRWISLEESLVDGRPTVPYYAMFDERAWETYVLGMRDLARFLLPRVIKRMCLPDGEARLLDVGGSHGLYAIECCRRAPELKSVVLDFEQPLRVASRLVAEAGMQERVHMLAGDILRTEIPGEQDLILLFNVIHGFTEDQNRTLLPCLIRALVPGGRMYVLDQMTGVKGASRLGRFLPLMVGLNLLNEIGGKAYTFADIARWCAGAASVKMRGLGLPGVGLVEIVR